MATPPSTSSLITNLKGGISSSLTGVTEPEPRLDFTDLPLSLLSSCIIMMMTTMMITPMRISMQMITVIIKTWPRSLPHYSPYSPACLASESFNALVNIVIVVGVFIIVLLLLIIFIFIIIIITQPSSEALKPASRRDGSAHWS